MDSKGRVNNISETIPGSTAFSTNFTCDNLDRLKTLTGPRNLLMDYDSKGIVTEKSDVGNLFGYTHPTKY
ncbi:MAG: hypothetical protein LC658_11860, partial [Bacteroidales bacterium]|nr:hypothetical protein [Bacteroidales bacterium]